MPLPPSQAQRLGHLGSQLASGSISVLIDHPRHLQALKAFSSVAGYPTNIFIKLDTGYHRAGIDFKASIFQDIVNTIETETEPSGDGVLKGFYSHAGHSYGGNSEEAAFELLMNEITGSESAVTNATEGRFGGRQFVLSIGATPTVTSAQNLFHKDLVSLMNSELSEQMNKLKSTIDRVTRTHILELHAGVYTLLDMQQLATRANSHRDLADVGLTILAEVASIYPEREPPEALIAAGCLALGREPCKSYSGWGVVADWGMSTHEVRPSGLIVNRVSQEHGILREESIKPGFSVRDLQIGQKVRIWPNHACVAGAGFGWYFVVDSTMGEDQKDVVVDIWVRWRGW